MISTTNLQQALTNPSQSLITCSTLALKKNIITRMQPLSQPIQLIKYKAADWHKTKVGLPMGFLNHALESQPGPSENLSWNRWSSWNHNRPRKIPTTSMNLVLAARLRTCQNQPNPTTSISNLDHPTTYELKDSTRKTSTTPQHHSI